MNVSSGMGGLTQMSNGRAPGYRLSKAGLNALTRDEHFTRGFLERHQAKLLYGSDCSDHIGSGEKCQGAQTIAAIRRLAPDKQA